LSITAVLARFNREELLDPARTQSFSFWVSDLTPLSKLAHLQLLNLTSTPVADLTPLSGLKDVTIWLDTDQQVTVPNELEMWVHRR
jgi:hypothetical protein